MKLSAVNGHIRLELGRVHLVLISFGLPVSLVLPLMAFGILTLLDGATRTTLLLSLGLPWLLAEFLLVVTTGDVTSPLSPEMMRPRLLGLPIWPLAALATVIQFVRWWGYWGLGVSLVLVGWRVFGGLYVVGHLRGAAAEALGQATRLARDMAPEQRPQLMRLLQRALVTTPLSMYSPSACGHNAAVLELVLQHVDTIDAEQRQQLEQARTRFHSGLQHKKTIMAEEEAEVNEILRHLAAGPTT